MPWELSRSETRRDEARRQTVFKSHSRNSCSNCKAHLRVTLLFYATAITRDDVANGDNCRRGLDPSEETRVDRGVEGARKGTGASVLNAAAAAAAMLFFNRVSTIRPRPAILLFLSLL